jgi:YVTN family beta-propeller protein
MRIRHLTIAIVVLTLSALASATQLRQIAIIDIPGHPGFDGIAFAGGYLVMTHSGAGTVDVFSVPQRRLMTQIRGMKGPSGVAGDEAAAKVYVANSDGGNIAVISTRTWQVLETIPVPGSPDSLVLAPEAQRLYAADAEDQTIAVVDLAHGNRVQSAAVGGTPEYMAYDPLRKLLFASLQDLREIVALDPALKVVSRYPLAASQPTGLALDAKARRLYVAVRYAVIALDADTGAESSRVATPAGVDMLWYDGSSGTLYAAANGSVTVIRAGSGKLENVGEFNTEVRGHVLAFDPANGLVYMPGGREGRSKLLILKRVQAPHPQNAEQVAEQGAATSRPPQ